MPEYLASLTDKQLMRFSRRLWDYYHKQTGKRWPNWDEFIRDRPQLYQTVKAYVAEWNRRPAKPDII